MVGKQQVEFFIGQLALAVGDHVLCFGRKAHYQLWPATVRGDLGDDVGVFNKRKAHLVAGLFNLLVRALRRPVIRHRGNANKRVELIFRSECRQGGGVHV